MLVTIFSDASYDHTLKVAGYGYWAVSERGSKAGGGRIKTLSVGSANTAEMMGVVNALHQAITHRIVYARDEVLIQTDSQSAIDAFTGKRTALSDQDASVVRKFRDIVEKGGLQCRFKHVKGHTGGQDRRSVTNMLCDQRAKKGLAKARSMHQANVLLAKLKSEQISEGEVK